MLKKIRSSFATNSWKSFALSIGAEYIDGGILKSDKIVVKRLFYNITISLGTNQRGNTGLVYTRFRCAYTSNNPIYFKIERRSLVAKLFYAKNDHNPIIQKRRKEYLISSSTQKHFDHVLQYDPLWEALSGIFHFKLVSEKDDGLYGPSFNSHEHQLCIEILREIKDHKDLSKIIALIDLTMDVLHHSGHIIPQHTSINY